MHMITYGTGTPDDPWILKTPPRRSEFLAWHDSGAAALMVRVGTTELSYRWRAIEDTHGMLITHGDWMPLGNADEDKPVKPGTLEAWARDNGNPVGGYYGLRKGYRGRFANYVPPVLEILGLVDLEHNTRNNRIRARAPD
ncbi:MAG: DUF6855 family protein [Pseudomonadota bacterium]